MNDKQKFVLGCVVLAAAVAGLGVLHFLKLRERADLNDQIKRFTREASEAHEKISRIPELRAKREKLIAFVDEYIKILPREEHVQHDAFVDIIDSYRRDTDIIIQKAEYVQIKEKRKKNKDDLSEDDKGFFRHRYKFKLLGTVPELIEFVNKIENHTRFLKVDAINIKPLGSSDGDGKVGSPEQEQDELMLAAESVKEIELTVSTYTYFKGQEKMKS